jgi:peptidyl-prolyl cis-trans isomerase SurA
MRPRLTALAACSLVALLAAAPALAQPATTAPPPTARPGGMQIVAIVNGDAITNADVIARGRLFAISTGIRLSPEALERLRPQIAEQLIDERLRLQEIQRRHVIVRDEQIAGAIREIEARNGMPAGALRARLAAEGVNPRTLVDQIRVQIGWTQVLRQHLGTSAVISETDIAEQSRLLSQQVGRPEFHVAEIFIPIANPARTADAERFAETVIGQLRSGAPFAVVAAQFSQSQTALQGGDLGWVQANQLDPAIAKIVTEMPIGAISQPVKVAGGFSIVQLRGRREVGRESGIAVTARQVFLPFASPLNPQAPTEQQRATLEKATQISQSVRSCEQMEQVNKANNSPRPADPGGEVNLASINPPQVRQLLATIPIGRATQPLISADGIAVLILCSREQKVLSTINRAEIQERLLAERVELASRQLQRDLRRKATIDMRGGPA